MNAGNLQPIANHLWQSTVLAGMAGLLVLALRGNRPRVRHWVWFAASCKFLIPFSLLIALGGHVRWRVPEPPHSNFTAILGEVSRPFSDSGAPSPPTGNSPPVANRLPYFLWVVWGAGFLGISVSWWTRWRRIQAVVRAAAPMPLAIPIRAISSKAAVEPGVFGILNPVLLLPEGLSDRLTPSQIEAVIAHELCHVRHRDNLIAAVQMFIETVFWFHPLVWWLGKRMVAERELACDEEVLALGNEPRVYAEGILNICKFCAESPLACVSGVMGSDLKQRIERIMHNRIADRLNFTRKAMLALAAMAALAAPILVGIINAPAMRAQSQAAAHFDVASIKPTDQQGRDVQGHGTIRMMPGGRLVAETVQLRSFIQNAYGVKPFQLLGGPAWIDSAHYNIDAKAEGNVDSAQMRLMMQSLLAERFKLKVHNETRELPVYELVAAKSGFKLSDPKPGNCVSFDPNAPPSPPRPGETPCGVVLVMLTPSGGQLRGGNVSMPELIRVLSNVLGRVVVDKTGFKRMFDVHVEFTPDVALAGIPPLPPPASGGGVSPPASDPHGTLFTAIQEQLGLKLDSVKGPVDVIVIDSAERPTEN